MNKIIALGIALGVSIIKQICKTVEAMQLQKFWISLSFFTMLRRKIYVCNVFFFVCVRNKKVLIL